MQPRTRALGALLVAGLVQALLLTGLPVGSANAGTPVRTVTKDPHAGLTPAGNRLDNGPLGVYRGKQDGVWPAYEKATGTRKRLLAKVALRPRVIWQGHWIPTRDAAATIRKTISQQQQGDPRRIAQIAIFRLWPNGYDAKRRPITLAQQRAYKAWIRAAAKGIGNRRVAIVLEPDLGIAWQGVRPGVRFGLAAYAAKTLGALPNTSVYLDAADSDWLSVQQAARMLRLSGVRYIRGFALGATHYTGVAANIVHGRKIVAELARQGIRGKRFVIDTADSARPFTWPQFWAAHPKGDFDNANVCRTKQERRCVTLGIPATWRVGSARWGLPAHLRTAARRYVDAYLWFGRPWLYRQASPFKLERTLQVARTTPWQ